MRTRARAVLKQLPNLTKQWVPDRDLRVLPDWETRWKCRGKRGCPNRPVASLWRKYGHPLKYISKSIQTIRSSGQWWNYCGDHLYGRRIRGGVVEHEVFVNDSGGTPFSHWSIAPSLTDISRSRDILTPDQIECIKEQWSELAETCPWDELLDSHAALRTDRDAWEATAKGYHARLTEVQADARALVQFIKSADIIRLLKGEGRDR